MQSFPSATYTELDQSTVPPAQLADIHGLVTPTLFGDNTKPYLITSVDAFKATFGGSGTASPFYPQIKRALARGTAFYIHRLVAANATAAVIALDTSEVTVTAKWKGSYGNKISVAYTPKGANPTCKIVLTYTPDSTLTETFVAASYTALIALVNAQSKLVVITEGNTPTEPADTHAAPVFLATGVDGSFTDAPARATAANLLLANFNNITDLDTIGILGGYDPADAANVLAYASGRGDCIGLFELDPAITPAAAATAAAALAIPVGSSFLAVYWGSGMLAWSPDDQAVVSGPVLPDVMAVYSYSDTVTANQYEAPAGASRGLIPNVQGFAYNLLSPAQSGFAKQLITLGINLLGSHPAYGPVVWGANTMNLKNSALDNVNVRRMMIWLRAQLLPIYDAELFEPMDVSSWLTAYNKVKPILQRLLADKAIQSWQYIGDQNAPTVSKAVYNKQTDLVNGIYRVLVNVIPTGYIQNISLIGEVSSLLSQFQSAE